MNDAPLFHELLDEYRKTSMDLDCVLTAIWLEHLDSHDGSIRFCDHPTCRAYIERGNAA